MTDQWPLTVPKNLKHCGCVLACGLRIDLRLLVTTASIRLYDDRGCNKHCGSTGGFLQTHSIRFALRARLLPCPDQGQCKRLIDL